MYGCLSASHVVQLSSRPQLSFANVHPTAQTQAPSFVVNYNVLQAHTGTTTKSDQMLAMRKWCQLMSLGVSSGHDGMIGGAIMTFPYYNK